MGAMYSNDFRDLLPGTDATMMGGGAGNPWDIGGNFVVVMGKYGLTAGMWFCPARPEEVTGAIVFNNNQPIATLTDVTNYMAHLVGGVSVANHNLWVTRGSGFTQVPNPSYWVAGTDPARYGSPQKTTDAASRYVPWLSDACFAGYGTTGDLTLVKNINIKYANNFVSYKLVHKYSVMF